MLKNIGQTCIHQRPHDFIGNACVTKKHLPLWTAQLAQVKDAIRHPKTSVITKQLLSNEADKIEKIVKEAGGEGI